MRKCDLSAVCLSLIHICPLIGEIGTYVVLVVLSIICVILITERTLLAPLGRQSRKAYEEAKKKHQETAVIRARQKEEERQKTAALADGGRNTQRRDLALIHI